MEILFSDRDIVLCVKPVGLDSEIQMPAALKETLGGEIYPVHRLDKNVGGVMVFARTQAAAASLSKAIQEGNLIKEYVALVHGNPPESGDWEDLLWKDSRKNKVFVVKRMRGGVKKARLSYAVLEKQPDRTLVQVRLFTGRTHQIRVQFASRKLPLIGDGRYGGGSGELALWSVRLTFRYHGKELCFTELPDSLGGLTEFPALLTME